MPSTARDDTAAAGPYARSLLELATEQGGAEAIGKDLASLAQAIGSDPQILAFLRNPGVVENERLNLLRRALGGGASPLLLNFLGVLGNHRRLGILPQIAEAYDELLDEQLGKIEVDVTVAQRLPPEQLEQVRRRVSAALGKEAVVHQYVDESIIGGLVLRVQDKLIDASVRNQLQVLRDRLLASAPR